jgi:hypothetical protein
MHETIGLRTTTLAERATVPFTYLRTECTVTLDVRPISSVCGRAMTFAATVAAVPPGAGTPTGTVTFSADDGPATPATLTDGVATFTTRLDTGPHTITAAYSGDSHFRAAPLTSLTRWIWRTGFPGPDEM